MRAFVSTTLVCFLIHLLLTTGSGSQSLGLWSTIELVFWFLLSLIVGFISRNVFLVLLFSVTLIRVAIARLKIDQIVYTYWVSLTLVSLVGLILVMWESVIMGLFTTT